MRSPREKQPGSSPARSYIGDAIKAATHPVRNQILRILKDGPKSTVQLEALTGRNRYDIYHHLGVLESIGLVQHRILGGKAKEFSLMEPDRPTTAVMLLGVEEIRGKAEAFQRLLDVLEELDGSKIPNRERVTRAEIILGYDWSQNHLA